MGEIRLWFLRVDRRPVAAWYRPRFGNVEGSYHPAWSKHSVGVLVLAHAMRAARGGEPYKYQLANADPGLESVAIARGARGNAALVVAVLITRWRASHGVRAPASVWRSS